MKKIYYIVVAVVVIIFAYFLISELPSFSNKLITVTSNAADNSKFSYTGTFAFKSTPERFELLNEMLNINSKFINNPPLAFPAPKNEIKNFYKLEKYFPDFKTYYITKLKVTDAIINELPLLHKNTSNLTEEELKVFFDNNTTYLETKWGINNFNDFYDLILTINEFDNLKKSSYELEESYFTMPNQGSVNFRLILSQENNTQIYLAAISEVYNSTNFQTNPVVKFFGTVLGGQS